MKTVASLGIFWIIDGEIISFSVPLGCAQHGGGFANYQHGHAQMWKLVVRFYPTLRGREYDQLPRGRITYNISAARFHILLPSRFGTNHKLQRLVCRRFGLSADNVVVMGDEHYDPPEQQVELLAD